MRADRASLTAACCIALSALWPWHLYTTLPGAGVRLTDLLCAALVAAAVVDVFRARTVRLPFELAWPAALIAVLLIIAHGTAAPAWRSIAGLVVFAAGVQTMRDPRVVRTAVVAAAFSVALSALVAPMLESIRILPTAYALSAPAVMHGPRSLPEGFWIYLAGAACGLAVALDAAHPPRLRKYGAAAAVIAITAVGRPAYALVVAAPAWEPSALLSQGAAAAAATVVGAWLIARVGARLIVASQDRRAWGPLAIAAGVGAWAVSRVVAPGTDVALHDGFLLAIAVTAARVSGERRQEVPRWVWPALAASGLLVVWGAVHVDPHQTDDPRHYEARVAADLTAGDAEQARARLARIEEYVASDRRFRLCWARTELAAGRLRDAGLHLAAALAPLEGERRQTLPVPTPEVWRPLLADVRDAVSAERDPAALLAYAYALAAAGEAEGAVDLLGDRMTALPPPDGVDPTPVAPLLAALLGEPELADAIAQWPRERLWGAAVAMGVCTSQVAVSSGPVSVPSDIALAVVYGCDEVFWVAALPAGATSGRLRLTGTPETALPGIPRSVLWLAAPGEDRGAEQRFLLTAQPGGERLATLRVRGERVAVTASGGDVAARLPVGWCMLLLSPDAERGAAGLDADARSVGLEDGI